MDERHVQWSAIATRWPGAARTVLAVLAPGPATIVGPALLDRRTGHRPVGAEDAAVARLGLEHHPAACALVEVLAGVCRHGFGLGGAARRTGQDRLEKDRHSGNTHEAVRRITTDAALGAGIARGPIRRGSRLLFTVPWSAFPGHRSFASGPPAARLAGRPAAASSRKGWVSMRSSRCSPGARNCSMPIVMASCPAAG